MALYKKIDENILYDIAGAIRGKLGTNEYMHPHEMASKILSIADVTILSKAISANGVYSAPSGVNGFNPVMVNVPNTFSEADNGKVVSGANLIPQSSMSVSQNSVYDTTFISEMTVDVAGGGGTDTSDATLESGDQMLSGYTAYARGSKYTGTIPMYNGSINSGSGSVPSYDYYSGSYTIVPSTVSQAFPTAGKIMSENLQVEAYSTGSMPDPYSGSYVITPSMISQAFPTAGKLMSQDLTVEAYSLDYYSGSYMITPSESLIMISASGKTFLSDLQIAAYNPSERAYQGNYVISPSTTLQTLSTSGKVMTGDLTILPAEDVYMDGDAITLQVGSLLTTTFYASNHASLIGDNFINYNGLSSVKFDYCMEISANAFQSCVNLRHISFPRCSIIGNAAFIGCTHLSEVEMPELKYIPEGAFQSCDRLQYASFNKASQIYSNAFKNCGVSFNSLYLAFSSVVSLGNSNAFDGTYFSLNASSQAKVYVPSQLVSDYKADSMWSYFSNCIVPIEEGE